MIKRITIEQLRLGMFVQEFSGSWMDHPFWRTKFMLNKPADLQKIIEAGVREVWIDTSKGLDAQGAAQSKEEVRQQVEVELVDAATRPTQPLEPVSSEQALAQAAALYKRSIPQMASLFNEARMGKALDASMCEALVTDIYDSVVRNPGALISVARLKRRDEYTYMHSVAVCALMLSLGQQLGLKGDQLKEAGVAGMLHDMGKALMPLEVLNKPGRLTPAEFDIMRGHPEAGHELLREGGTAGAVALDVCLHHHEKIDGTGYPHGLQGEQISLFARMGAVCDVYDAVTSTRPYKTAWDPGEALRQMAQWKGHFDARIFQAFIKCVGIYPIGSLIRLQSGRLAVVLEQNPASLLTPKVKVFFSTKSNFRIPPEVVDLSRPDCRERIAGCESPADWPFKDLEALWGAPSMARSGAGVAA